MNYQTLTPELLEQLTAIAPGRVFAGSDINEDYSHDEMPIYGKATPEAVVEANSTEEIAAVMKFCNEHHIPVTPRGAGTGLVGGAVAIHGGVLLVTTRMNKILGYDTENMVVRVQAGVLLNDLAEDAAKQAESFKGAPGVVVISRYPAAGLREVNVSLDSDDITVKSADGTDVVIEWEAGCEGVEQPTVTLEEHTLSVRRANPDVFKTFFSVFQKEGGKVTVRVPRGYAADYVLSTTSGDIRLYAIDVDKVKVNTTSGDVRVEPDAGIRAKEIDVTTISGGATVSACAGDVVVSTVSGKQFVSCDANRADLNVVSGKIHAEGASEEWEISSVSGDAEVLCTVAPTRKIQINSMSASVHVALPGDIRGFVADISSISGKIVNEFGPNRYGTCALPIHMDTMSGKLMLTRL